MAQSRIAVSDLDAAAYRQGTFTRSRASLALNSLTPNSLSSSPFNQRLINSASHFASNIILQVSHLFSNLHRSGSRDTTNCSGILYRISPFGRIFFNPSPCRLQQCQRRQVARQSEQSPHLTVYHPSMFVRLGTY